ncbi:hypothetical protein DXG01_005228, partial [Tephrocybe rancida]
VETVDNIIQGVQSLFVDGKPQHISKPESSRIKVITHKEYGNMSPCQAMDKLRAWHLLITGIPYMQRAFDTDTLSLVGRLNSEVNVHDHSVPPLADPSAREAHNTTGEQPPYVNANYWERCMPLEYLLNVLACASAKSINALDNPLPNDPFPFFKCNSGELAWLYVMGCEHFKRMHNIPLMDLRWALASTGGTIHNFHVDANSYCTFVSVDTWAKYWIAATPKQGKESEVFASIDLFTGNYAPDIPNLDLWDLEAILLVPDPSDQRTTAIMEHIPDLSTFDGFVDLMIFCNWFKFSNVLCPWGYNSKLGTITDRFRATRLRAAAWRLLDWAFNNYEFDYNVHNGSLNEIIPQTHTISGPEAIATIQHCFLVHQAHALIHYKKTAWKSAFGNVQVDDFDALVTPERFEKAMQDCLEDHPAKSLFKDYTLCEHTLAYIASTWSRVMEDVKDAA